MTQSGHSGCRTRLFMRARACESKHRIVLALKSERRGELPLPRFDLLTCDRRRHQAAEIIPIAQAVEGGGSGCRKAKRTRGTGALHGGLFLPGGLEWVGLGGERLGGVPR